jgi:hypothetical protein
VKVVNGKIVKTGEIPGDAESQATFRAMWWEPRCRTAEIAEVFGVTRAEVRAEAARRGYPVRARRGWWCARCQQWTYPDGERVPGVRGAGGRCRCGPGRVVGFKPVDEPEVVERGHIYRMAPPWKLPMDDETNATVAAAWAAGVPMEEMGKWWGVGIHTIAKRVRRLKLRGRKVVRERSAANLAQDARMRAWTGRRKEA